MAREIDVIASRRPQGLRQYTFVVECKVSKNHPWILLEEVGAGHFPRHFDECSGSVCTAPAERLLLSAPSTVRLDASGFINGPSSTAYGVVTAFKKDRRKDRAFAAAMTVCKAARWLKLEHFRTTIKAKHIPRWWTPVIALDGRLFSAVLKDEEALSIREVDWGRLAWRNRDAGEVTLVDIVTRSALDAYVGGATGEMDAVCLQ